MKQFLRHIFLLLVLLTATANVWAAWTGSGAAVKEVNGIYYVVYQDSYETLNTIETGPKITLSGPGEKLSYTARRTGYNYFYYSYSTNDGSSWTDKSQSLTTSDATYTATLDNNVNAIRFLTKSGATLRKYISNVRVTMAQYIENPSKTTLEFGSGKVDDTNNTVDSFTIPWCNVPAMTYTIEGSGRDCIDLSIENNSGLGKYNTATFTITYDRTKASNLDVTLTINNSYGNYSKTIKITGSTSKYDQTLSWDDESAIETNMQLGKTQTVTATATSELTVTYSSSDNNFLTVDANGKITAVGIGKATITASQTGNYKYNAASITKEYTVWNKNTPIFTPNGFNEANVCHLKVGDKVTLEVLNVSDGLSGDFKVNTDNNILEITRNGNTITIEALNAGTADAIFTQTENYDIFGVEKKYQFSVSKINNTLAIASTSYTKYVDDEIPNIISSVNSDAEVTTSSSDATIAYYDVTKNKIFIPNSEAKSFSSKTITITVEQAETYKYTAAKQTITLTVNKHTPEFTLKSDPLYFNKDYPDYFTSTANSPLTLISSDTLVAKWVQGSNSQSYTLKTFSKTNTATLTAIQHENYYWQRWEGSVDIQLQNERNHVPLKIESEADMRALWVYNNHNLTWDGGVDLQGGDYADKFYVFKFEGYPKEITFKYKVNSGATTGEYWSVEQSDSNGNWGNATKWVKDGGESGEGSLQLNENTRYIRLCYSGNGHGLFYDIEVSRLEEFYASEVNTKNKINTLNFDIDPNGDPKQNQVGAPHELSFDFHYANVGHDVKLSTNDPEHFTLSQTSFKNIGGEKVGKEKITVTYSSPNEYTAIDKKLYITDELGNTETIALTASSVKATQTLTWQGVYAAEKPVVRISDGEISNLATASSGLQVTYRSSDESIVKVSEDSLSLIPLQMADAVEITAIQKGNNVWNEVKETKTFRITDKLTQLILWPNTLSDLVIGGENIALDAKVYVVNDETGEYTFNESLTSNLHYEVENINVVAIEDGVLKIKGIGDTYLIVTAPGNTDYAEASLKVLVRVRAESTECEDYLLSSYYTNEELRYFQMNLNAIQHDFEIDRTYGEPGRLTLQHRGAAWAANYKAEFVVYYSTITSNDLKELGYFYPKKNESGVAEFELPRDANKFYIKRLYDGQGYQYLSNIQVHPAQYVETNVSEIDFGNIYVGSQVTQTFTVNYCNTKSELYTQTSSSDVQVSPSSFGGCNAYATQDVTVSWIPSTVHAKEQTVTFLDPVSSKSASVRVFANVLKGTQTLNWVAPTQIDACGQLSLPEETNEHIALSWTVVAGQQYADFEDGQLVIKGNGTITLRASNSGSENYNEFQNDYPIKIVYNPIFLGTEDNDWNNPNNWNVCHLPSKTDVVTMQASTVFDTPVTVGGLVFHEEGSIQILSKGGLIVGANGITGTKADGSSIIIDNTPQGAGFLKVDPSANNKPTKVTVNYTTEAYNSGNPRDEVWQYMGAPGKDMAMSDANNTMIYHWNEQKGWLKMSNTNLQPFVGYAFTQNKADSASFQIQATPIIPNDVQEIELTVTPTGMGGSNLFVNSFLAPIDLAKFDGTEFVGEVDKTFYLFNSGSWKDWQSQGGKDHMEYGTSPGQYFALTPGSAALVDASLDQTTIPSMQGVYVIAREDGAKIKLDYAKHVYAAEASNQPMRAPQRISEDFKRVRLQVNSQNSGADRMYVIQHEAGTAGYDNGYDARNMAVNGQVAIYTHELDGQMEISVSNKIDSTYIGFRAGSDSEYTLRMTSVVGEEMYLKDLVDNILIPVVDGQDYTFSAPPNSVNDTRFLLLGQKGGVATDIETVQLYIHDNMVHVMQAPQNSTISIYTVGGVAVANYSIGYAPCTIDLFDLSTGVYVLRINDKAYKFVCK